MECLGIPQMKNKSPDEEEHRSPARVFAVPSEQAAKAQDGQSGTSLPCPRAPLLTHLQGGPPVGREVGQRSCHCDIYSACSSVI